MPYSDISALPPMRGQVSGSIARASSRTGVDFDYLLAQAGVESAFDPSAKASTSSASGLFQFTDQTWLGMLSRHGDKYGYGWASDAIRASAGGNFSVGDAGLRSQIMNLRFDAEASSLMAAEFAAENRAHLRERLGFEPEQVDLYLAHFLGPAGAEKFLRQWKADPAGEAASSFPQAARANRPIFYGPDGAARSYEQIRTLLGEKLAAAGANGPMSAGGRPVFAGMSAPPRLIGESIAPRRIVEPADGGANRHPSFQMQEIIPMPRRLDIDFARSTYERLSRAGGEA